MKEEGGEQKKRKIQKVENRKGRRGVEEREGERK